MDGTDKVSDRKKYFKVFTIIPKMKISLYIVHVCSIISNIVLEVHIAYKLLNI